MMETRGGREEKVEKTETTTRNGGISVGRQNGVFSCYVCLIPRNAPKGNLLTLKSY